MNQPSSAASPNRVLPLVGMVLALAGIAGAVWAMHGYWSSYWQVGGLIALVPVVIMTIHAGVQGMVAETVKPEGAKTGE